MNLAQKAAADIVRSKHREMLRQWTIQAKHVKQFPCNYRTSMLELSDRFLEQQHDQENMALAIRQT